MVTLTDMSIRAVERKLAIIYFVYSGSSISICLTKVLTTICLSSMLSILSTKAIAFVVDFSIQYEVNL
jgi:hypothetical protein